MSRLALSTLIEQGLVEEFVVVKVPQRADAQAAGGVGGDLRELAAGGMAPTTPSLPLPDDSGPLRQQCQRGDPPTTSREPDIRRNSGAQTDRTRRVGAGTHAGSTRKKAGKSQPFVSQVDGEKNTFLQICSQSGAVRATFPESFLRTGRLPLDDSVSAMVHRKMKTLPAKPHNLAKRSGQDAHARNRCRYSRRSMSFHRSRCRLFLSGRPCRRSGSSPPSMARSCGTSPESC